MKVPDIPQRVLDCANKVAGTNFTLDANEDLALEEFQFDSLTLFAFMTEIEKACGLNFDDALAHQERLKTVRSTAELIEALRLDATRADTA